jgi:biopolymer transport protein ExbD
MRFPRQAKIFRGQLDPAPVAAVVFLLVIFIQLGSLLYTPGVLVHLSNPLATISVARDGQVLFGTNSYKDQDLGLLRAALQNSPAGPPFDLRVEPGAPPHRVDQVRDLVGIDLATISVARDGQVLFGTNSYKDQDLSLLRAALQNSPAGPPFDLRVEPGAPPHRVDQVRDLVGIDLPTGSTNLMLGTDNPTVVVAVNFLGQYFYDNGIVGEHELTNQLKRRLKAAARQSKDLTLVVWADKRVDFNAVTRLERWAGEIGIKDVVQAERAAVPSASSPRPGP